LENGRKIEAEGHEEEMKNFLNEKWSFEAVRKGDVIDRVFDKSCLENGEEIEIEE
jgi:hypothetical protein